MIVLDEQEAILIAISKKLRKSSRYLTNIIRRYLVFILELKLMTQADSIFQALDGTIDNFDRNEDWIVKNIGKIKSVEVNGLPAAYTRVELDLVSGERIVPFVFYFTIVGGRESFFLLQGSTHKPVRKVREEEVFRMIKSFKVIKE